MVDSYLNLLLKEYERKKLKAELDLEKRKKFLYDNYPEYAKIENDLNSYAILTTKNILNNSSYSIDELKNKISTLKEEKTNFLYSIDLDENYLKPQYECSLCKDTGYIMDNNYKTKMCNCLKQKLLDNSFNKSNISNLNSENFSTFNENVFSDDVDISKYKFNISPRANIKRIKNGCLDFVNNFDDPKQKNLLFTGNTGLR